MSPKERSPEVWCIPPGSDSYVLYRQPVLCLLVAAKMGEDKGSNSITLQHFIFGADNVKCRLLTHQRQILICTTRAFKDSARTTQ
jgi:hypothetical protein